VVGFLTSTVACDGATQTMTKKTVPLKAILALVQYLEVAVSDWLDQQPGIPDAAERERWRLTPIKEAFAKADVATGDF
jgi:hypothetical protein